jgi:hypothetical protein
MRQTIFRPHHRKRGMQNKRIENNRKPDKSNIKISNLLRVFFTRSKVENEMLRNEIKTLKSKKTLTYSFVLLFVITVALAFTPHYSCACGEIVKRDGSVLSHHIKKIAENVVNAIRGTH